MIAPATAARLLLQAAVRFHPSRRRLHFSVLTASRKQPPSVPYHWQRGRMFGISFERRDAPAAEAWLNDAMRAGYCPFHNFRKRGDGFCPREIREALGDPAQVGPE